MEKTEIIIKDGSTERKFLINKMSALQAEQWMYRAAFALGGSVDGLQNAFKGEASDVIHAILSIPYDKARPLLDDLLACCVLVQGNSLVRLDSESACATISSPLTLMKLRIEALRANFGFFFSGDGLTSLLAGDTETRA